ncbi:MAG: hypothetical protein M1830_007214 [Pleopsidium flavum]|nr:MAG: hypothetical protein M1830_007214 [Pleopsidium flavum]
MPGPYPSRREISEIFAGMAAGNYKDFFAHVIDDVDWTVMGHHPLAGQYTNKAAFQKDTLQRLGAIMEKPLQMEVRNVVGGGDEEWAVVELIATSTCKNGEMPSLLVRYRSALVGADGGLLVGLKFDNTYAWVTRWNKDGKIVQVRAYLDSALVKQALEENE